MQQNNQNFGRPSYPNSRRGYSHPSNYNGPVPMVPQPFIAMPYQQGYYMPPAVMPRFQTPSPNPSADFNPMGLMFGQAINPASFRAPVPPNAPPTAGHPKDETQNKCSQFINLIYNLNHTDKQTKAATEAGLKFTKLMGEVANKPSESAPQNLERSPKEECQNIGAEQSEPATEFKAKFKLETKDVKLEIPQVDNVKGSAITISDVVVAQADNKPVESTETCKPEVSKFKITSSVTQVESIKVSPTVPLSVSPVPEISEEYELQIEFVIGKVVNGRRTYGIDEMFMARSFDLSKKTPQQLLASYDKDSYIRITTKRTKVSYTRSKGAWVGIKEKMEGMSTDERNITGCRSQIQLSLNKFTRKTQDMVFNEVVDVLAKEASLVDFFIDGVYKYVASGGVWISELADLCTRINEKLFLSAQDGSKSIKSGTPQGFNSKLILRFFAATKITEEFLTKFNELKSRKPKTVEELDDINEELQLVERSQRIILTGSAKFLGCLCNNKIYNEEQTNTFMRSCTTLSHDLEVEMVCAFLTTVIKIMRNRGKKDGPLNDILNWLKNIKKTKTMRIQFIIEDLIALYDKNWKSHKEAQAASGSTKEGDMFPQRSTTHAQPQAQSANRFANLYHHGFKKGSGSNQRQQMRPDNRSRAPFVKVETINAQPYRGKRHIVETPQPVSKETTFDAEIGFKHLLPIIESYTANHDIQDFIASLKDMEIANHMAVFVERTFNYIVDSLRINYVYFGQLLASLINEGRMKKTEFLQGFSNFMVNIGEILIDYPGVSSYLVKCLIPLVVAHFITLDEVFEIVKHRYDRLLVRTTVEFFEVCLEYTCLKTAKDLFQSTQLEIEAKNQIISNHPELSREMDLHLALSYDSILSYVIHIPKSIADIKILTNDVNYKGTMKEFCNLVHFSCPATTKDVADHVSKIIERNVEFTKSLLNSEDRLREFYRYLDVLLRSRSKLPHEFARFITQSLIKTNIAEISTIDDVIYMVGNEDFINEFNLVKKQLSSFIE